MNNAWYPVRHTQLITRHRLWYMYHHDLTVYKQCKCHDIILTKQWGTTLRNECTYASNPSGLHGGALSQRMLHDVIHSFIGDLAMATEDVVVCRRRLQVKSYRKTQETLVMKLQITKHCSINLKHMCNSKNRDVKKRHVTTKKWIWGI